MGAAPAAGMEDSMALAAGTPMVLLRWMDFGLLFASLKPAWLFGRNGMVKWCGWTLVLGTLEMSTFPAYDTVPLLLGIAPYEMLGATDPRSRTENNTERKIALPNFNQHGPTVFFLISYCALRERVRPKLIGFTYELTVVFLRYICP